MSKESNYTQYLKELYGDKVPVKPEYPPIKKIYIASSMSGERREYIKTAAEKLRARGYEVYVPMEHQIPNAWDYPNNEWGLMVFTEDIHGITMSDCVVMLNYGRTENNTGSAWEAGFAFGIGMRILVVDIIEEHKHTSLMVENGRAATVEGLDALDTYDFDKFPPTRTIHEQS